MRNFSEQVPQFEVAAELPATQARRRRRGRGARGRGLERGGSGSPKGEGMHDLPSRLCF